jgi:hypothetical protein
MLTKRRFLAMASTLTSTRLFSMSPASAAADGVGRWSPIAIGAGGYITGHSISNDGSTLV